MVVRRVSMSDNEKINYIEFPSRNLSVTKEFFSKAFGWSFIDFGSDYVAIENAGINGGFYHSDLCVSTENGSPLVVLYSSDLEQSMINIENAGGEIIKPILAFPGGRRFHFEDPNRNEYAVWSDKGI